MLTYKEMFFIKPSDDRGRYLIDMMDSFNLVSQNSLPMCSSAPALLRVLSHMMTHKRHSLIIFYYP